MEFLLKKISFEGLIYFYLYTIHFFIFLKIFIEVKCILTSVKIYLYEFTKT